MKRATSRSSNARAPYDFNERGQVCAQRARQRQYDVREHLLAERLSKEALERSEAAVSESERRLRTLE